MRAYKPELTPDQAEQLLTFTGAAIGAGKVISVAGAFRAAGLGAMVDAYRPPAPATPPSPAIINVGTVCPDGGVLCQKPQLAKAMALASYTHVIREHKGLPALPAAEQIDQARAARGRVVDVAASG